MFKISPMSQCEQDVDLGTQKCFDGWIHRTHNVPEAAGTRLTKKQMIDQRIAALVLDIEIKRDYVR